MRLLFPGARLGLQEDLTPAVLERGVGTDAVDFGQLSHGAREQIALISRLAYADLLKEAGKPTLKDAKFDLAGAYTNEFVRKALARAAKG